MKKILIFTFLSISLGLTLNTVFACPPSVEDSLKAEKILSVSRGVVLFYDKYDSNGLQPADFKSTTLIPLYIYTNNQYKKVQFRLESGEVLQEQSWVTSATTTYNNKTINLFRFEPISEDWGSGNIGKFKTVDGKTIEVVIDGKVVMAYEARYISGSVPCVDWSKSTKPVFKWWNPFTWFK